MNYDLLFAILFYAILYLLFLKYRKRFDVQGKIFILYRTQLGIRLMEQIAKKIPRTLHALGILSTILGFAGMALISGFLVKGTIDLVITPDAPPVLTPVLPGVETIPGAPVLSFWHWIIAIFLIAIVHEFMHGVYARRYNIPIKSSGFAFLGPLLAAFVEPDEKIMQKKKTSQQLAILSAGPFANILFAALTLVLLLFVLNPIANTMITLHGVQIVDINKNYPIAHTPIKPGFEILAINEQPITTYDDFVRELRTHKPGETILLRDNQGQHAVTLAADPNDPQRAILGVSVRPSRVETAPFFQHYPFLYTFYNWILRLTFWIFTINLGVGLFNLLPIGPIDGGRMFLVGALALFKDQQKARKAWLFASLTCLALIFINLLPFLIKFLKFLLTPLSVLIGLLF